MFDDSKIAPVPAFEMPQADFEAQTTEHQDVPHEDNTLAYTVRLPSDWNKLKVPSSGDISSEGRVLGEVAKYYSPDPAGSQSFFVINVIKIDYAVSIKNWFLNYTLNVGNVLQGLTEINENKVEGLFVVLENGVPYYVRCTAELNGDRAILSLYYVPESRWKKEQGIQERAIKSVRFKNPDPPKAEPVRTYAFMDLARFDYPESWKLTAPNIRSVDIMDAKILNMPNESTLNGEIRVHIVSTEVETTLADEVNAIKASMEKRGFLIGKVIDHPSQIEVKDHIYFSRVEVYETNDKEKTLLDYEFWIAVLIEDRYFYIITMLSPSRDVDFINWSRNTKAFEVVSETMRP